MAKFCRGFKFNSSLKLVKGILYLAETEEANVDPSKAVTGCGQMWDGDSFNSGTYNLKVEF